MFSVGGVFSKNVKNGSALLLSVVGVLSKYVKKLSALFPSVVGVIAYPYYPVGVITPSQTNKETKIESQKETEKYSRFKKC